MKKILLFVFALLIVLLIGCEESTEPEFQPPAINEEILADQYGNKDAVADSLELANLHEYFEFNKIAFVLRGGIDKDLQRQEAAIIINDFYFQSDFYIDKSAFRNAYYGVTILHEAVAIMQIEYTDGAYILNKYYRAPGNNIASSAWYTIELY